MAEDFLNGSQVRPGFEQVGREGKTPRDHCLAAKVAFELRPPEEDAG
jgi:hypothetical protein